MTTEDQRKRASEYRRTRIWNYCGVIIDLEHVVAIYYLGGRLYQIHFVATQPLCVALYEVNAADLYRSFENYVTRQ